MLARRTSPQCGLSALAPCAAWASASWTLALAAFWSQAWTKERKYISGNSAVKMERCVVTSQLRLKSHRAQFCRSVTPLSTLDGQRRFNSTACYILPGKHAPSPTEFYSEQEQEPYHEDSLWFSRRRSICGRPDDSVPKRKMLRFSVLSLTTVAALTPAEARSDALRRKRPAAGFRRAVRRGRRVVYDGAGAAGVRNRRRVPPPRQDRRGRRLSSHLPPGRSGGTFRRRRDRRGRRALAAGSGRHRAAAGRPGSTAPPSRRTLQPRPSPAAN